MMDRMCHSHANEQPGRFCVCPSRRVCSGSSRFFRLCLGNGRKNIRSLHDGAHQSENPDAVRRVCQKQTFANLDTDFNEYPVEPSL